MRFVVKSMSNGDIGVYDTERGSYPVETDELRAIGVSRLDLWLRGDEGQAEAVRISDLLNEQFGDTPAPKTRKGKAKADDGEAAIQAMGQALIEDERRARNG